ncbi:hypothetical protein BCR42DRAFT_327241 [Absidia repens]|uniref:PIPK domain-containing protein n=1 Tax=Absidia repens TaxID=90262 RepID=A0A1X2II43_9FUNG|nr:hypothetical protein BCR42DRAFT_327241 [Absidia repens]
MQSQVRNLGNRISAGHRDYLLMYNMLVGIRIAVNHATDQFGRELTMDDYKAVKLLAFDITGSEQSLGANYDFKFKDYAPLAFQQIRQVCHISSADYLDSLTSQYILSEMHSPGKSGNFFYFSRDFRYIIKTIQKSEHHYMRGILHHYYNHIKNNPRTLLCRYYGLHCIRSPLDGQKLHFVVMENVLPSNKDVHEIYDLKGSKQGRFLPNNEMEGNPVVVLKDLNWEKKSEYLKLGPTKRAAFEKQLKIDVEFLISIKAMDYSLMVGIHDLLRGNNENVRHSVLHTFEPDPSAIDLRAASSLHSLYQEQRMSRADICREILAQANPNQLDTSHLDYTWSNSPEERNSFYTEHGGYQATDENNVPLNLIYYFGVIDLLTKYNLKKRAEHLWKSIVLVTSGKHSQRHDISAISPPAYGKRFLQFITQHLGQPKK